MSANKHPDNISERRVCSNCVGEAFLRTEIVSEGENKRCSYCKNMGKTITIDHLADRIEAAVSQHFERTSTEPSDFEHLMLSDRESNYDWERHGEPVKDVISNLAEIDESITSDVQSVLESRYDDFEMAKMGEECEYDSESYYEEASVSISLLQSQWRSFEESLKTETRFFSPYAEETLSSIFDGLTEHKTWKGRRGVVDVGPSTAAWTCLRRGG